MSILSNESTRFFDIIYWNFEPELDFLWKNRPVTGSRDSFQNFERHCSKTALDDLTRKSAVSLQWHSKSWKLAWEPVEIGVWRCFWFQWRISVSKMGSSVQNYWKKHRNIQNREKISKKRVKKKGAFFGRKKKISRKPKFDEKIIYHHFN